MRLVNEPMFGLSLDHGLFVVLVVSMDRLVHALLVSSTAEQDAMSPDWKVQQEEQ